MLRVDRLDGVATLTLDRPEVGNALDDALVARLGEALAACAAEPALRVVVVTGAGRVFSAGADLNWMRRMRDAGPQANQVASDGSGEGEPYRGSLAPSAAVVLAPLG